MRIKLDPERKTQIARALMAFVSNEFDEELSEFRAEAVVDFMQRQIEPPQFTNDTELVYTPVIADARKCMTEKIDDLETDFFGLEDLPGCG